jgi:predicted metal-dependent HD superfamily phosphohydrolase
MAKITVKDLATGEMYDRDMTAEENAAWLNDVQNAKDKEDAKAKAAADKASVEAKLAALGLTTDDLKALGLGGN